VQSQENESGGTQPRRKGSSDKSSRSYFKLDEEDGKSDNIFQINPYNKNDPSLVVEEFTALWTRK
jgi:hypothetical protein